MNKQPSKESLKDKVKGIFGLGTPRPQSKQSDAKPSEFIITTDIIKVRRKDWPIHTNSTTHFFPHRVLHFDSSSFFFFRSSTRTVVWATGFVCWTTYVSLPKQRSLKTWVEGYHISDTVVHAVVCVCQNLSVPVFFSMQWRPYGNLWKTCCLQSSHLRPDMLSCSC